MISRRFFNWVDDRQVIRRLVLGFTMYMTYIAFYKGYEFAILLPARFDGIGTAAVIAAFTAPVAFLQKSAFEAYLNNKGKPE